MVSVTAPYLFREANSFPRAKLEEDCELRGTDNVQGQISEHIFKAKLRLLCLLSFKYFSQQAGSASPSYVNTQSFSIGFQNRVIQYTFPEFRTDFASVKRICLGKKYNISMKGKHIFLVVWIQVADTIYKQLTVKNVNSVWSGFFGVFWYRSIDQQVYLFFCYESKPFCHPNINFNVRLESLKSVLKIGEYRWGISSDIPQF